MARTLERRVSILSKLEILFGGVTTQMGWFFLGFGMIFVWIFVMNSTLMDIFSFGRWEEGKGKIVKVQSTNSSVNEEEVYQYYFSYQLDGQELTGRSYSAWVDYEVGDEVPIEFKRSQKGKARIQGTSTRIFPAFVGFVLIFPLIGFIIILANLRSNWKAVDLIEYGQVTWGKKIGKRATNTEINERTVYEFTFEFKAGDGQTYQVKGKTHQTEKLEDEGTERLIYDPENPSFAVLYDVIPNAPKMHTDGSIEDDPFGMKIFSLIVPFLTIIGHGSYMLLRYVL